MVGWCETWGRLMTHDETRKKISSNRAVPPHLLLALPVGDARGIPEILREGTAGACNGLLRGAQGAQGRVGVEGPVAPGFTWSRAPSLETSEDLGSFFIPSGELTVCNGKIHHAINGKIHYFDWAIFNSFLYVYQMVPSWIILPVRPFWKNIPMMAIMASLPLAISAANFFSFKAAGAFTKPLGMPRKPAFSKSPGALLGSSTSPWLVLARGQKMLMTMVDGHKLGTHITMGDVSAYNWKLHPGVLFSLLGVCQHGEVWLCAKAFPVLGAELKKLFAG